MPTYALLGATGATGSAVLRFLVAEPPKDLKLNILVRSKAKLEKAFPKFEETVSFRIAIFEGSSTDGDELEKCLTGVETIFMCVGSNASRPEASLMYDTSASLIDALEHLRKVDGTSYHTPTVLFLRAAPINPVFKRQMPSPVRLLLWFCLYYSYTDLQKGSDLIESTSKNYPDLLQVIFVDPGALHDATGTERTGHRLILTEKLVPILSYADLGAAFCELAERRNEFSGKGVGVNATGKVKTSWGANIGYLANGLKNRVFHAIGLA